MTIVENEQERIAALRDELDYCLKTEEFQHSGGRFPKLVALNKMVWIPDGYDIKPVIRQWAKDNDVSLYEVDWSKVNLRFVNDYENGLLKALSEPRTVMLLENYLAVDFDTRYLVNSVYKDRRVGGFCKPAPNFYFAIATGSMDDRNNKKWDPSERCFVDYQF